MAGEKNARVTCLLATLAKDRNSTTKWYQWVTAAGALQRRDLRNMSGAPYVYVDFRGDVPKLEAALLSDIFCPYGYLIGVEVLVYRSFYLVSTMRNPHLHADHDIVLT